MKEKNKKLNNIQPAGKTVVILIVLVVILGIILIKYWPSTQNPDTTLDVDLGIDNTFEEATDVIGVIEAIDSGKVTIRAVKERNQFSEDKIFTVAITEETEWCIPLELLYDEEVDEFGDVFLTLKEGMFGNEVIGKKYDTTEMKIGASLMVSFKEQTAQNDFLTANFACYYP